MYVCMHVRMYVTLSVYCCVGEPEVRSAVLTRQSAEAQHSAHCDILGNTAWQGDKVCVLYSFWSHTTLAVTVLSCVLCAGLYISVCLCVVSMTLFIVSMSARCIVVAEHVRMLSFSVDMCDCLTVDIIQYKLVETVCTFIFLLLFHFHSNCTVWFQTDYCSLF